MRTGLCILFAGLVFSTPALAFADTTSDLEAQIKANKDQVDALTAEIAVFQKKLDVLGAQKNTLQSTISSLAISQKQLASQIKVTQSKIASANLTIRELTLSIGDKEATIAADHNAIAKALRPK